MLLELNETRGSTYLSEGWLPPADECPELSDLRVEHLRLLGVMNEALGKLAALTREIEIAEDRRADALRDAILAGKDPKKVNVTVPDADALARAQRDYDTTVEALTIFVRRALAEIAQTAPTIEANIELRLRAADEKRAEARRLLDEANRLAADPARLRSWLDRYVTVTDDFSGETRKRSVLGPIAFDQTDVPMPVPVPGIFNEITGLAPAEVLDVGDDSLLPEEEEALHATH